MIPAAGQFFAFSFAFAFAFGLVWFGLVRERNSIMIRPLEVVALVQAPPVAAGNRAGARRDKVASSALLAPPASPSRLAAGDDEARGR